MFGMGTRKGVQTIGFLLVPDFSMIAFTSAIEPLRAANRIAGKTLFEWTLLSADGLAVAASNGVQIMPDQSLDNDMSLDTLIVCAGSKVNSHVHARTLGRLRDLARSRPMIGAVCTGTVFLAQAGLLKNRRCTIHWENVEGLAETFPELDITSTLFEVDQNRFTCSGGTAPLDMMIHSIRLDHGDALAMGVAEQLLHTFLREPDTAQRMSTGERTGIRHPKLLAAIAYMEVYLETPLTVRELADNVNISLRQLERLFVSKLETTPTRYYLELRLQRARQLLKQTGMSVLQVAVSTGFTTASHFTQSYKAHYGHPPSHEWKRTRRA